MHWLVLVVVTIEQVWFDVRCNICVSSGYNKAGYDRQGLDRQGYNQEGYDAEGFNILGYNRIGEYDGIIEYDKDGYNVEGYNRWEISLIVLLCF